MRTMMGLLGLLTYPYRPRDPIFWGYLSGPVPLPRAPQGGPPPGGAHKKKTVRLDNKNDTSVNGYGYGYGYGYG